MWAGAATIVDVSAFANSQILGVAAQLTAITDMRKEVVERLQRTPSRPPGGRGRRGAGRGPVSSGRPWLSGDMATVLVARPRAYE